MQVCTAEWKFSEARFVGELAKLHENSVLNAAPRKRAAQDEEKYSSLHRSLPFGKLWRTRSWRYRSWISQNTRWEALDEIYQSYIIFLCKSRTSKIQQQFITHANDFLRKIANRYDAFRDFAETWHNLVGNFRDYPESSATCWKRLTRVRSEFLGFKLDISIYFGTNPS